MNVLVIGCGLLGRKIARTMDEMGWDVSVLSNIESDLELLENDFEGVTFRGFPMDIRNLREAGIELSDFVRGNEKARGRTIPSLLRWRRLRAITSVSKTWWRVFPTPRVN